MNSKVEIGLRVGGGGKDGKWQVSAWASFEPGRVQLGDTAEFNSALRSGIAGTGTPALRDLTHLTYLSI
jgi:hypothetical protein